MTAGGKSAAVNGADEAKAEPQGDDEAESQGTVEPEDWTLYLLVSERLTRTYVGIAHDAERRLVQHTGDTPGGARSTRAGRPWKLAKTWGPYPDRSTAQRAEAELKRVRGAARIEWVGLAETP